MTPAKSLTLGPLKIPDEFFSDFFRGSIDGDGSIVVYNDRYNALRDERYVYERLYVSLVSASRRFLDWVQSSVQRLIGIHGSMTEKRSPGKHSLWRLRYAKQESISALRWMYYAPDVPCLHRKRVIAERFLQPLGHAPGPPLGRPRAGWLYNEGVVGKNFENPR